MDFETEVPNPIWVFTDGACSRKHGRHGWGAVLQFQGRVQELGWGGPVAFVSSNQIEMEAAIRSLEFLEGVQGTIRLYSDSKYVVNGMRYWLANWKRYGWTSELSGEDVKNQDLWKRLDALAQPRMIEWHHIHGHRGLLGNERADRIATTFCHEAEPPVLYSGPVEQYDIDITDMIEYPERASTPYRPKKKIKTEP